jgi:hypothetical protein
MSEGPYGRHGFNANAGYGGGQAYGGGASYSAPSYGQGYGQAPSSGGVPGGAAASYGAPAGGNNSYGDYGAYGAPDNAYSVRPLAVVMMAVSWPLVAFLLLSRIPCCGILYAMLRVMFLLKWNFEGRGVSRFFYVTRRTVILWSFHHVMLSFSYNPSLFLLLIYFLQP